MPSHKGNMILTVHREGGDFTVEFEPADPDELAAVAAVVRALITEGGVDFGQLLEYLRRIR